MKFNKFLAPVMAGALALTLGLAGCGGSSSSSSEAASSSSEAASSSSEAASSSSSEAASSSSEPTTEATVTEEDKIIFWEGESDKGDVLLYGEDDESNTATLILFGTHDGQDEALAFSGPVVGDEENGTVTITDSETGDTFSFQITGATLVATGGEEDALTIDLGDHGTGKLKPVTEKQFNEEVDKIAGFVREVGEQLKTLDEQDVEEILTVLTVLAESASSANTSAQSAA